ncbi:hypothetical protein [Natrinema sp. 1APR25-10V2]|uniref:DUF7521 family protein n=1 Tax=Natrinema sp. 1APR25-10V2 TaxID=2951081 RepID=UPI002874D41D|nr:hypothetical protein [Natrinema sp. 1APR25-10V2]MDS0474889.1 hypothetical protein [Natrinema sp. 1APR25-10V2]
MTQSPSSWLFLLSNVITFGLGTILTVIAYKAYKREGLSSLLIVTVGFAVLTLGTVTEALYEFGVKGGVMAFGRELYLLRTAETIFIAVGLVLIIYSVRHVS